MRTKLFLVVVATSVVISGCSGRQRPDYAILTSISKTQLSSITDGIQKAKINNLQLPTKLPYTVTTARLVVPMNPPQHSIGIGFVGGTHSLTEYARTMSGEKVIQLGDVRVGDDQMTKLNDGTRALFGKNAHISSLAWIKDSVWYNIISNSKQNKPDLTEKQLVKVADSFR